MTTSSPKDSFTSPIDQPPQSHRGRRRANRWISVLTLAVIAAQVISACGPAETRGAAGGMDASLLENARQFGAVPPLNMSNAQPLAMANAPSMTDMVPDALQSVIALDAVDAAVLEQIDPNAAGVENPEANLGESAPAEVASFETESAESTSSAAPSDSAPSDSAPSDSAPGDSAPGDSTPGDSAPGDSAPGDSAPGDSAPGDSAPGDSAPGDSAPSDTIPGDVALDTDVPESGPFDTAAETAGQSTGESVSAPLLPVQNSALVIASNAVGEDASVVRTGALQGDTPVLDKTTNILVMGSDRRVGAPNWLTDVMMIVALDYEYGRAGVISLPRDIYLDEIAGHRPNKINVVDYLGERDREGGGGPELLGNIIQEKMGIRIDHYVRFDFRGFIALVDALDGVEVEIDCPYYDYFSIENVILNVKPGLERLSGDEALVYVRSRRIGGDLDRARRQQRFVWAVRNQVLNESILPKLPSLYNAVSESVQTDIGIVGTLRIARFAMGLDKEDITGFVIGYPLVEQGYAGGMWVFHADWEAIRDDVQNVFDRDPFIDTNTLAECP